MIKLKTYKVFSTLLLYPSDDLKNGIGFITDILKEEKLLSFDDVDKLKIFVSYIKDNSLLFLQESYVSIFDRQKHFSLYLFEHIHGDSRERGMAMIDLKNLYTKLNFELSIGGELPDYIPVFLEYLSLLSEDRASALLGEIVNIIAILCARLKLIKSSYSIIFSILESLSKIKSDEKIVKNVLNDDSFLKSSSFELDKNWEEPKIF